MDDDDTRRGRPAVHKKFGEACAILAGDALLTHAFELLGKARKPQITSLVAHAIGAQGVIGGQVLDMELGTAKSQKKSPDFFLKMYSLKTGKLFEASILGAAMLAPKTLKPSVIKRLRQWALEFGFCFQLADDLADLQEVHRKKVPTLATARGGLYCVGELAKNLKHLRFLTAQLPIHPKYRFALHGLLDEIFKKRN